MDTKLTAEKRLDLLEAENRSLKLRMMKAENNAQTGIVLGKIANIALPILTFFVILMAVKNGLLETDFVMNVLLLTGVFFTGFILPFVTRQIAVKKVKENK